MCLRSRCSEDNTHTHTHTLAQIKADYTGDLQHCAQINDAEGTAEAREVHRVQAIAYFNRMKGDSTKPIAARKRRRLKSMHWGLALDNCLMSRCFHIMSRALLEMMFT